jgi:hypothetical protein
MVLTENRILLQWFESLKMGLSMEVWAGLSEPGRDNETLRDLQKVPASQSQKGKKMVFWSLIRYEVTE